MSEFDGNFMWAPSSSPSPRTMLVMLNQTDNGLNPTNEIFSQANLSRDHNDQSEQRLGHHERLASRIGFNPPTLNTKNISPLDEVFRNQNVPSPLTAISPGFSPSTLLQSPMFPNSSEIIPMYLNTNYEPPKMVESFDEGNTVTLIFSNDLPHLPINVDLPQEGFYDISTEESAYIRFHVETFGAPVVASFESDVIDEVNNDLTHQLRNFDLSFQEGLYEIPMEESIYNASHESHVEPFDAPLVASFESDVVDKVNKDLPHEPPKVDMSLQGESNVEPFGALLVGSFKLDTIENDNEDLHHQPMNIDLPPQEDVVDVVNTDLHHQPMDIDLLPLEGFYCIPSLEANVEPSVDPLVASFVNNNLPHQPMNVNLHVNTDMPLQKGSDAIDEVNIISMEDEEKNDEEKFEDQLIDVDHELNGGSSSSKRRKIEATNMIGTTRTNKTQSVILQMESEEDNPDDGFHWKKYGHKVIKGNPNARSYYKCNSIGCKVKKHIERGAKDDRLVITTYYGIHDHPTPSVRKKGRGSFRSMNRSNSSMSQNQINGTANQLSWAPSSFLTSLDMRTPFSLLGPQTDMTNLYMTGHSKMPTLPGNHQNSGFTYQNEEPMINVIPDSTTVYNRIMNHVYANFGASLHLDML